MKLISAVILLLCTLPQTWAADSIQYIDFRTKQYTLGVSPSVGGRIYKIIADSTPIIHWDEDFLVNWRRKGHYPYHMYGGQELWLSPQSQWKKAWPPNLNLTTNPWKILKQDARNLSMQSPAGDNGIWQAQRDIVLQEKSFTNTLQLTNISKEEQKVGLWFMTRTPRDIRVHIPPDSTGKDKISKKVSSLQTIAGEKYIDVNYNRHDVTKVYYNSPSEKQIILTRHGVRWNIDISYSHEGTVHADQANYEFVKLDKLLEVEHHSPYVTLKPGESIRGVETWTLTNLNQQ